MVSAEYRGKGLGTTGDVCSRLAPVRGPILRSGARGQVQRSHCGPHAGARDPAWRLYFLLRSSCTGIISAQAAADAPCPFKVQSPGLAVPSEVGRTAGPSV